MRARNRRFALVGVLAVHLAALYLLQESMRGQNAPQVDDTPPLRVTFFDVTPVSPRPASPEKRERLRSRPVSRPRVPAARDAPRTEPVPEASAPSTAITDWRAEGAAAAGDIGGGKDRVSHPFAHEYAPEAEKTEPGVFGPKNEHPAGTVQDFGDVERHWVTDSCFYDFPRHTFLEAPMPGPKVKTLTCAPKPTGGTQMFKKFAPGYLTPPAPAGGPR